MPNQKENTDVNQSPKTSTEQPSSQNKTVGERNTSQQGTDSANKQEQSGSLPRER